MQNAVIYARYSSHSQRDVSIDQRVNACREVFCQVGVEESINSVVVDFDRWE